MFDPNSIIFYVKNPAASASFYMLLLNQQPIENSPTFVMFTLKPGLRLGLWSSQHAEPPATSLGGGGEIGLAVGDIDTVNRLHETWLQQGVTIIQSPVMMDFGFTFVALDPDNHRIRVFHPNA
ncbi:VOC family protein [Legionella cardiaca]|uniref:VOC family protein n=1 Tax=Legionella cardiaca TaxID=1071983 RepID=A0ABY8AU57_9GAMM|nr:VOC family protein [Legionella cardiaca]WED44023.1 VOC family protein [Legionella cardiaca]